MSSKLLRIQGSKPFILFLAGSSANSKEPEEVDVRLQGLVEVSSPVKGRPLPGSSALAKGLYRIHPSPYCNFTRCTQERLP